MKKLIIATAIIFLLAISLWMYFKTEILNTIDWSQIVILSIIIGFGLFVIIKRSRNYKNGEPLEDELSKLHLQKAAAYSFYASLYMWLILSYVHERRAVHLETEQVIGYGIVGMAIVFAACWAIFKIKGFRND
jgi:hypothetical protein